MYILNYVCTVCIKECKGLNFPHGVNKVCLLRILFLQNLWEVCGNTYCPMKDFIVDHIGFNKDKNLENSQFAWHCWSLQEGSSWKMDEVGPKTDLLLAIMTFQHSPKQPERDPVLSKWEKVLNTTWRGLFTATLQFTQMLQLNEKIKQALCKNFKINLMINFRSVFDIFYKPPLTVFLLHQKCYNILPLNVRCTNNWIYILISF